MRANSGLRKGGTMKLIAYLLGIILIVIAVVYFVTPADHLPSFPPLTSTPRPASGWP